MNISETTFAIIYIIQIAYSFFLLQKAWRYTFDLGIKDIIFFGGISLIPIAFVPVTFIWVMEKVGSRSDRGDKVVLPRYTNKS